MGAEIDVSRLPRPRAFDRDCAALDLDPLALLASGGEDYELLFAFRSGRKGEPEAMLRRRLGVDVRCIGAVRARPGIVGLPRAGPGHHFRAGAAG